MRKTVLVPTIPVILVCVASTLAQRANGNTTIKASVVAYNLGVEQADGLCKQTFIARRDKSATRAEADRYIVVRYKTSCTQLIPEERLNTGRKRNLKLKRDATCDQIFEQLRWFVTISPGGTINKDPWLKTVRGWEEIKVPAEKKLPCYVLTSSEL